MIEIITTLGWFFFGTGCGVGGVLLFQRASEEEDAPIMDQPPAYDDVYPGGAADIALIDAAVKSGKPTKVG